MFPRVKYNGSVLSVSIGSKQSLRCEGGGQGLAGKAVGQ